MPIILLYSLFCLSLTDQNIMSGNLDLSKFIEALASNSKFESITITIKSKTQDQIQKDQVQQNQVNQAQVNQAQVNQLKKTHVYNGTTWIPLKQTNLDNKEDNNMLYYVDKERLTNAEIENNMLKKKVDDEKAQSNNIQNFLDSIKNEDTKNEDAKNKFGKRPLDDYTEKDDVKRQKIISYCEYCKKYGHNTYHCINLCGDYECIKYKQYHSKNKCYYTYPCNACGKNNHSANKCFHLCTRLCCKNDCAIHMKNNCPYINNK